MYSPLHLLSTSLVVLVLTLGCSAWKSEDFEDIAQLLSILSKPRQLSRYGLRSENGYYLKSFSWSSCGTTSDAIQLQKLTLSPDPIKVPGNVTISAAAKVLSDVTTPIKVDLEIKKHILVWVTIPCVDNVGSCSYENICTMAELFPCPPAFQKYGIPCRCPIKANTYSVPSADIPVDPTGIPEWATDGDYKINVKVSHNGKAIMCLDLDVSLTK